MTDFSFKAPEAFKSPDETKLLANEQEAKLSKKGKPVDLTQAFERYTRVSMMVEKIRSVAAGLKATNDPAYMHTHSTLLLLSNNLEEALK